MANPTSDGILLVDKPAGVSSHDVVALVRRARHGVRTGHTGTLDPFATGLLLIALGHATRLIRFLPSEPKVYQATIAFGASTDTDDGTGTVVAQAALPDESSIRAAIPELTGTFEQRPPAYSARHVGGRRAYQVAREGIEPLLEPTTVTVHSWDVESIRASTLAATITCTSGTYIRALARDLGARCGSAAHLAALRRTRIGPFDVADAVAPDESNDATVLAPADALGDMPRQVLTGSDVDLVRHGRSVAAGVGDPGRVALIAPDGALIAVAERDGEWWQPRVVLNGA